MRTGYIPFNRFLGLQKSTREDCLLQLPEADYYTNHLGSVHASAQFALAEAATGEYLAQTFPELVSKIFAVVRSVNMKYKRPGNGVLSAKVQPLELSKEAILTEIDNVGLIRFDIAVSVLDANDDVTMKGKVQWILQRMVEEENGHITG